MIVPCCCWLRALMVAISGMPFIWALIVYIKNRMKTLLLIIILLLVTGGYAYADTRLEDWGNINELKNFLRTDNTDQLVHTLDKFDCGDIAGILRDNAAAQGKRLEVEYLTKAEVKKYFGWEIESEYHAVNKAVVAGNILYWVEPQNDKIRQVIRLDSMTSYQYQVGE